MNDPHRPFLNNKNYLEFLKIYKSTLGWIPERDHRRVVPARECRVPLPKFFDIWRLTRKSYLEEILAAHAALAKRYDAVLVVVFQPVACTLGSGRGSSEAREVLRDFKRRYPEVAIPFPLIETWPSHYFSVPAHVKREFTHKIAERLGRALAKLISQRSH